MSNIVTVLQGKATQIPKKIAYVFLQDGKNEFAQLTYEELDQKAKSVAAYLQSQSLFGERVLLLYPSGLDFVAAFMGCLYAGAVPVPLNCPVLDEIEKSFSLLKAVAEDAAIAGIFTPNQYFNKLQMLVSAKQFIADINHLNPVGSYIPVKLKENDIAYLQYTSGSTSTPKGAVILHKNLKYNLIATIKAWKYTDDSITLNWAPHSHVYGLSCGILVPLYHGTLAVLMPTSAFITRPLNWLEAISKYRATHGGCPNFGYELCVRDINSLDMNGIDLSCWKVAINGGEAVQADTLI